ncbi:hypothetical protein MTP99_016346 [Tenebrio molitor]|jgi:hypothetical protein|uniref:Pigment dispersing factor n=1 Tax=Tenebrio molitor TaxID=7067 RepID=A0A977SQC4_TENMO|nr:hypothetical protein MTP99_016346 [Tenebrio molitor]UXO98180.1 pigment dispersing factor [Tenebrio molitor]CAH1374963.1 unnamed protein product [Tenebrio molitor]
MRCTVVVALLALGVAVAPSQGYPSPGDDYRYLDRDYASPGAHQLASWIASQLRPKEYAPAPEVPILPYRLPLQGKRNSEVSNAIMGSEETQKMYRDGKK